MIICVIIFTFFTGNVAPFKVAYNTEKECQDMVTKVNAANKEGIGKCVGFKEVK